MKEYLYKLEPCEKKQQPLNTVKCGDYIFYSPDNEIKGFGHCEANTEYNATREAERHYCEGYINKYNEEL